MPRARSRLLIESLEFGGRCLARGTAGTTYFTDQLDRLADVLKRAYGQQARLGIYPPYKSTQFMPGYLSLSLPSN